MTKWFSWKQPFPVPNCILPKQKSYRSRGILELIVLGTQKLCNPGSMQYWRDILEVRLRELFKELLIQEKQLHQYEQQH